MPSDLETEFDAAMMNIYHCALNEAGYRASRFLQMLMENGGLETARILVHADEESEGYTALWERGRLDLTVEALVIKPKWDPLFATEDRAKARQRLEQYGFVSN